jgi:hypothetical protein
MIEILFCLSFSIGYLAVFIHCDSRTKSRLFNKNAVFIE